MSSTAVILYALLGAAAGWTVLLRIIESWPERATLPLAGRLTVTVINGVLWGLVTKRLAPIGFALPSLILASVLLTVSVIDLRVYRIPDKVTFPALALSIPAVALGAVYELGRVEGLQHARNAVLGMLAYFVALFLPHLLYPRGMGFGDVKLGLLMGLYLGWFGVSVLDVVYLVLLAILLGCVVGVVMGIAVNLIRHRGGAFPFGPALAIGTMYVVLTFDRYLTGL